MTKTRRILYWVFTIWLCLGMTSSAIVQLLKIEDELKLMDSLEYPYYILNIIGIWKLLGVVTVLIPRFPLLKEWAYAGFFFLSSGALLSHMAMAHGAAEIFPPVLLLVLTVVSWYLRPADRKVVTVSL